MIKKTIMFTAVGAWLVMTGMSVGYGAVLVQHYNHVNGEGR